MSFPRAEPPSCPKEKLLITRLAFATRVVCKSKTGYGAEAPSCDPTLATISPPGPSALLTGCVPLWWIQRGKPGLMSEQVRGRVARTLFGVEAEVLTTTSPYVIKLIRLFPPRSTIMSTCPIRNVFNLAIARWIILCRPEGSLIWFIYKLIKNQGIYAVRMSLQIALCTHVMQAG